MAISRIGWYAIWLISLLSYAGNHRVSPLGVSPFAWMQSPADPEAKPIWIWIGIEKLAFSKRNSSQSVTNIKGGGLGRMGPKTMKKHWVFLIFSSKHVVLLRKSWCFWVLKAIRDPGWPHQFRAAKKIIEKPWVFELYFWQPSSWPAKLSS